MARAQPLTNDGQSLYERDFYLWVEEQARSLREGRLESLDVVNLLDEIEALGISRKHAVTSALVVILKHLLKHQFQTRRRSRSWLSSIAEHRPRLRQEFEHAPSLRGYALDQFEACYRDGRRQALIETGLAGCASQRPALFAGPDPRSGVPARLSSAPEPTEVERRKGRQEWRASGRRSRRGRPL